MFDKTNIQNKITPYLDIAREYLLSLRDIRNVGMLVFTVIVLLISWSGVKSIQTNYGLQKEIARMSQENDVKKLENTNLALQNQYYGTDQYLEVTARQNLGLALPGETELLIPEDVAISHTVAMPTKTQTKSEVPTLPFWQQNFQDWMNFFLHRQS